MEKLPVGLLVLSFISFFCASAVLHLEALNLLAMKESLQKYREIRSEDAPGWWIATNARSIEAMFVSFSITEEHRKHEPIARCLKRIQTYRIWLLASIAGGFLSFILMALGAVFFAESLVA